MLANATCLALHLQMVAKIIHFLQIKRHAASIAQVMKFTLRTLTQTIVLLNAQFLDAVAALMG